MKLKLFAMQKTDFELFCRSNYFRASMHRITSLELLGTLIAVLEQKRKSRDFKPTYAKSIFLSQRKLIDAILSSKLE